MGDLTANFSLSEFACPDGTAVPSHLLDNVQRLADNLQVLRDDLDAAIAVTSGYRTLAYNRSIRSADTSQHLLAKAADIMVAGHTPQAVHTRILQLIARGSMAQGGLGLYTVFVHYDVRGTPARWDRRS